MALWQFEFSLIPKNVNGESWKEGIAPEKAIQYLDTILKKSMLDGVVKYGESDSTCIELFYEDDRLDEILCRLDLRNLTKLLLGKIVDFCKLTDGVILYNGKSYPVDFDSLRNLMLQSRAAKFCQDPAKFLSML